jgi:K+ transporter
LYLLRNAGIAHLGPSPAGALPLEQLDGTDAQPLARMALAWLPAGLAAGVMIATLARSSRTVILGVFTLVAAAVLLLSAAGSDAVANSESFKGDLTVPLSAAGIWVSLVLLVIGAAIGERLAVVSRRAPSAA